MNWRKNLYILCVTNFFANIAFNMIVPFLPELLRNIGVTKNLSSLSGLLTSITYVTYAIMLPVWGSLADRKGKRPLLLRSALGIGVSYFLMAYSNSVGGLFAARALNGALSGYTAASIILVSSNTPAYHVGYALGALNTAVAVGSILGPMVGGSLIELLGVTRAINSAGALMFLVGVGTFFFTSEKVMTAPAKTSIFHDIKYAVKDPGILVPIICLSALNLGNYMLQPVLPLFISGLRTENAQFMVGIVFSISAVSLALGSPIINRLHGRRYHVTYGAILIYSMIFAGVTTLTQALATGITFLVSQRFFFGFFQAGITVASNVVIAVNSPEEIRGRVFSIVTSLSAIGYIVGPSLGGVIGDFSYRGVFIIAGVMFFIVSLYLFYWNKKHPDLLEGRGGPED